MYALRERAVGRGATGILSGFCIPLSQSTATDRQIKNSPLSVLFLAFHGVKK